jgi:O-antigen ligase
LKFLNCHGLHGANFFFGSIILSARSAPLDISLEHTTPHLVQFVFVALILVAFLIAQAFIGGAKVVFSIPSYLLIASAGVISICLAFSKGRPAIRQLPALSAVALAGYVVWRALTSPNPALALPDLMMVLGALCVYLLTALYIQTPKARLWLLSGCFVLGFLHVVAGVIQFRYEDDFMFLTYLPDNFPLPQIFRNASGWRASGFYVCPNHTAGYLETICAFAAAYCCWGRFSPIKRTVLGYVVVFCLVGIALTGSRGGYLSTGFGIATLVLLSLWFLKSLRSHRFGIMMVASVVLGAALIGGAAFGMSRNAAIGTRMADISYDAGQVRFDMWQAAVKQYKLNPTFGTGSGTYLYYGREFRSPNVQRDPIHVHCDYLELLAEYGIVGCVLLGLFVVAHIHAGISAALRILKVRLRPAGRSSSNELAVLAGALASVAALLAHSVVDFNFHLPANTLFFAAIFGMLATPTTDPKLIAHPKFAFTARAMCFLLPAVSCVLAEKSVTHFRGEYHTEWARVHLRNKLFVDSLASFQASVAWGLTPLTAGVLVPANGAEFDWSVAYQREYLFPQIKSEAKKGMIFSPLNVDAPYYLAEAEHFMGIYEPDPAKRLAWHESAVQGFILGQKLFPQDSRYDLKLARTLVNLGRFEEAQVETAKAIASDPNFGNSYAFHGFVLWQQKKLLRAEAYYRKAVSFQGGNDLASVGLQDVARVRALAANPEYVEEKGNPLEEFDLEPPTEEDLKRGVGLPQ